MLRLFIYFFYFFPSETTASESNTTSQPDQPAQPATSADSSLLTGTALESSITELMSLGYSREQVMRALNASYHNADRAAEYLLSVSVLKLYTVISGFFHHGNTE